MDATHRLLTEATILPGIYYLRQNAETNYGQLPNIGLCRGNSYHGVRSVGLRRHDGTELAMGGDGLTSDREARS
jgi:hypothetical protein